MNVYKKQFDMRQETPAYWHNKSHDLLISARIIWKAMRENRGLEINCWATYKMLMGISFELLFKAHCVGAGIRFAPIHDLVMLARTANFSTTNEENQILKIFSEYIIWDGKYPVPKRAQHLESYWKNESNVLNDTLDFENLIPIWRKYSDLFIEKYN